MVDFSSDRSCFWEGTSSFLLFSSPDNTSLSSINDSLSAQVHAIRKSEYM